MEVDRALIGTTTAPVEFLIERSAILRFVEAVGDPNPLFRDVEVARRAGHADVLAPPSFPVTLVLPEVPVWLRSLDRKRILAGEQSFRYARPLVAGDRVVCRMTLKAVEDKTGRSGTLQLLHQEIHGTEPSGAPIFVHRRVTVYRGADSTIGAGR